jgi:LssY-like putative type I secretion system component LssY
VVHRIARAAALLVLLLPAYAGIAYGVLPAVWRRHSILPATVGLPRMSYTAEGIPADPINVAIVGTRGDLLAAMRAAGWTQADRISLRSGLRDAGSILFDRPYSSAPMSTHFVARRRPQDVAFEQLVGRSPRRRHHVRFWIHGDPDARGRMVWLGAASYDRSVGISRFTGEVMHHIDPAIDRERDKLVADLRRAGRMGEAAWVSGFAPAPRGRNGGGDRYATDGRLAAVRLLRNEPQDSSGPLADPEVSAAAPEREEVAVSAVEDVSGLAGRVNEDGRAGVAEVDDLPVARAVGHAERPVQAVRPDVDGGCISALPRLQAEDRAQTRHRVEDSVRKAGAVEPLPSPALRIRSEAPAEPGDRVP